MTISPQRKYMVIKMAKILLTCVIQYILNVEYKTVGGIIHKNKDGI